MNRDIVASTRRANLVSTFGTGSLLPSRDDSFMIAGLDSWPIGERISEPRLAASLGVHEFMSPSTWRRDGDVPAVRFPRWSFCTNPKCRQLGPWWVVSEPERRRCAQCMAPLSPSRFVSCCQAGHIEDFPYGLWVHEGPVPAEEVAKHQLRLEAQGHSSALSDLVVRCTQCGKSRSMAGAFNQKALRGLKNCSGKRPWLETDDEGCDKPLRTLQRGSSNVWFAQTRSSISIPSPTTAVDAFVEEKMRDFQEDVSAEVIAQVIKPPRGITGDDIRKAVERRRNPAVSTERPSDLQLRAEEYAALTSCLESDLDNQFMCAEVDLTGAGMAGPIAQICRVSRLREVRALTGFTRIHPVADEAADNVAPLTSRAPHPWLPAIEVLGEGVFVRLEEDELDEWARSSFAVERSRLLQRSLDNLDDSPRLTDLPVSLRSVALHSLAHLLIDEMALTAGYPAASLRERVYDQDVQAGILIYTATADSAGSLGGLAALSDAERFSSLLMSGIERARWCTADPVCIESEASGVDGLNLAACHACLLVPETSCERYNLTLDRASLVGTPQETRAGLFRDYPTPIQRAGRR